jgi:hypothetical protein
MLDKEDFLEWKKLDVTKLVFASIVERIKDGMDELSVSAGVDQLQDRFKAGMLHAYRQILDMSIDETEI